eukprot:scaffold29926_cov69-Phaeocystis_antarctica.AAC.4
MIDPEPSRSESKRPSAKVLFSHVQKPSAPLIREKFIVPCLPNSGWTKLARNELTSLLDMSTSRREKETAPSSRQKSTCNPTSRTTFQRLTFLSAFTWSPLHAELSELAPSSSSSSSASSGSPSPSSSGSPIRWSSLSTASAASTGRSSSGSPTVSVSTSSNRTVIMPLPGGAFHTVFKRGHCAPFSSERTHPFGFTVKKCAAVARKSVKVVRSPTRKRPWANALAAGWWVGQ